MGVELMKEDAEMKKLFTILTLAAILAACNREELPQVIEQPETPTTYTLSIKADKGDLTRALDLSADGKTINARWAEGEQVIVYMTGQSLFPGFPGMPLNIGTLRPSDISSDGLSCTLTGDLDAQEIASAGGLGEGDVLQLIFPGSLGADGNADQDGTLETIQNYYDYLHANVTISSVDGTSVTTSDAVFVNDRAIVRFTLKDDDGTPITPTYVSVTATPTGYTPDYPIAFSDFASTYASNGDCFFVAIGGLSGGDFSGDITINATAPYGEYAYTKSNVSFTAGKFYSVSVKMVRSSNVYDLGLEGLYRNNGVFTAKNGYVLVGTFPDEQEQRVRIADGATVTLRDVTINNTSCDYAGIGLDGSATIILEGENTVIGNSHHAGILLGGPETTLTIGGDGSLTVAGGYGAAGIGCSEPYNEGSVSCGALTISSGTITATGGHGAAGIGCSYVGFSASVSCGAITISGGTVTARGEYGAAGIGCSLVDKPEGSVSCGAITISGGTTTATGGSYAAGIGCSEPASGGSVSCGAITINDPARVTATKGQDVLYSIGPSYNGYCESVTIYGLPYWDGVGTTGMGDLSVNPLVIPIP